MCVYIHTHIYALIHTYTCVIHTCTDHGAIITYIPTYVNMPSPKTWFEI